MILGAKIRRQVAGASLLVASLMLILGFTVLEPRLQGVRSLVYWAVCIGVTFAAVLASMVDLLMIRRESREAQRELVEETMRRVEEERRKRDGTTC